MRIVHHIVASASGQEGKILKQLGIEIPEFPKDAISDSFAFDLYEDSDQYKALEPYIKKYELMDMVGTEFTQKEVDEASTLVIQVQWINGFPQPESNFRELIYDCNPLVNGCVTPTQKGLFQLKKEPKWGNKKIFHLNWVYDEIFVRKDVFDEVFAKYGLQFKPVLLYKKNTIIESTVQLVIPETSISLALQNFNYTITSNGTKLYAPYFQGFFPKFESEVGLYIWKSKEWFGSGQQFFKRIFVTQHLRQKFLEHNLKVDYIPLEE